jgi:hypothetical protein
MASNEVHVTIADLPEVKARMDEAAELIHRLRGLLREWEPRVTCPQCGQRYSATACGPAHAAVWALVHPAEPPASDEERIREAMAEAQDYPGRIVTR